MVQAGYGKNVQTGCYTGNAQNGQTGCDTDDGRAGRNTGNGKPEDNSCGGQPGDNTCSGQTGGNSFIELIPPKSGAVLAALTADLLADGLSSGQIASLAAFITIIGDSLGFIAAQKSLREDPGDSATFTR